MTVPFRSGFFARPAALAAVASLLAAGCSAPPGTGDDDVPEFGGAFQPPAPGAGGAPGGAPAPGTTAPGTTAPVNNNPVTPPPAGAAPSEQTGGSGIGLAPSSSGSQGGGQGGAQSQGAGGSTMVGSEVGAGGSSFEPEGAGGSTSMPPSDGAQQPPPGGGNQQPPPQQPVTPPSGDCNGAFFCDGFESVAAGASPSPALWSLLVSYSPTQASPNVQVSSGNAHSGNQALRIEPAGRAGIVATVPQSSYFIRAFMQIDNIALGPVFIGAGTDANDEIRFRIQGQSFATINSVGSPQNDAVRPAAANSGNCPDCLPLTANEWLCVEMEINSATSTATLSINGVEAAVAGADAFAPQPANPTVFFGSMDVQGGRTGVWIDDIAVGSAPIGCD